MYIVFTTNSLSAQLTLLRLINTKKWEDSQEHEYQTVEKIVKYF